MKLKGLITVVAFIGSGIFGSAALAAMTGREDNSSLVVWIFLGFCALIVVAQLLPLLLQMRIFARMHKEASAQPPETETVKVTADK